MTLDEAPRSATLLLYEAIARQSKAMLDAARAGDWDNLVEAEQLSADLIKQLQSMQKDPESLSEAQKSEQATYLRQILADDAAIRDITEPHIRQLGEILRSANNHDRLNRSYGSP